MKISSIITALFALLTLALAAAPATLVQSVTYNSQTVTMQLKRENLRGANFQLRTQNAAGGYDMITPVLERSYIGTVDGYPGAISSGILQDNGTFRGAIYFDRGVTWFTLGTSVEATRALDYGTFSDFQVPSAATVSGGHGGTAIYGYDLSIDATNDYYVAKGSSVASTFELIEYSVAVTRAIYMRDVLLRPYLSRVIIRTTLAKDPYASIGSGQGQAFLDALKVEWNSVQNDVNPDLVAGVSTNKVGGGLAFVGVVGGTGKYSVNSSDNTRGHVFDVTFRHEMGHNWGCGHFVGGSPEGAGIMGGNAPGRFSGPEVQAILSHRDVKIAAGGILDNDGIFTSVEIPPYASLDVASFKQSIDSSVTIAVLANDHDANGQALSLLAHDSVSARGGSVIQQGQNLVYIAPKSYLGTDFFSYTVTDTAGKTATGKVVIDVEPTAELRLYLALNETSGTTAADKSLYNNPAILSGTTFSAATTAGKFGNAVNLDGVDDHVQVSGMNLESNTVTMTAWVRQGATQNTFAGIIFDRTGPAAGLNTGNNSELRYHWNGTVQHWQWNSGLTPPVDTWTFVALVIEPSKATMYMNSGGGFQSAVNIASHLPVKFGTTYVGWDTNLASKHFKGAIDDVRIYDKALSQANLQVIYQGGGAESPSPVNAAIDVTSTILSWSPGVNAISHDVYLGTSESAVTNATNASPQFRGNTTNTQLGTPLANQTQYFWRVDTVTASGTLAGRIWSFTTGTLPGAILINFGQGGSQTFAGGQLIGPTGANSSNWNQTIGSTGTLAALVNNAGTPTGAGVQWVSSGTWSNNGGTADDEHRMAVGYLDDGTTAPVGTAVTVTLNNIPYASYRVYGLFSTDQNQATGSSCSIVNFNVNGTWALGGTAITTAAAWGTINANQANNGSFWTQIVPGSVQGNYWSVDSTGATCSILGGIRSGSNRGSLTAVIIEDTTPPGNNPPIWISNPISEVGGDVGVPYSSTLADDASDPNPGDTLTFSKVSGPAWLNVAASGDLTGTPMASDSGANQWVVRVTDNGGLQADATLKITVNASVGTLFNEDFERTAGTTIANGWIEQTNDSRIFDTAQPATKILISVTAGTPFSVVNQLPNTYQSGGGYELLWKGSRAAAAGGTLNYHVSIGTWNGTSFTPLASQTGSITNVNQSGKIAGPSVNMTASAAEAGQQIAVRFEVLTGSSQWVGFDDIKVNALGSITAPTGFSAAAGNAQVALSWNAASNASGYALRRATSSGGPYTLLNGNLQTTSYTDNAVTNGTTYYYTVSSVRPAGESAPSGEINARPLSELQAWRLTHFGTIDNTGDAQDDADPDGDGISNKKEFNAGTDPNDRNSRFHISSAVPSGNDLVVSFPTISGKIYRVEWSDSLQSGSWTVVLTNSTPQENIPGTGGTVQVTDTNGSTHSRRFYHAVVE